MICVICGKEYKKNQYGQLWCSDCGLMSVGEAKIVKQLRRLADAIEDANRNGHMVRFIDISESPIT